MELREALSQIAEIRQQMARSHTFRGYRSATTAFSGTVAIITALLQQLLLPSATNPLAFVLIWVAAASLCLLVVGTEMLLRTRRGDTSTMQRELTVRAIEQFIPTLVAGALLTAAFCVYFIHLAWLLPALWMILFSLGVFASCTLLPAGTFAVGAFYLLAGIVTLILSPPGHFDALFMGATFSIGQFSMAAILHYQLERHHV